MSGDGRSGEHDRGAGHGGDRGGGGGGVCVLGSINMDLVVRTPRLPRAGETILGGPYRTCPGGKGANQAVAAARAGARVSFIGAVGDDAHGAEMRRVLAADGVDLSRVRTVADEATGVALITVEEGGENTIVVASGANGRVGRADVLAAEGTLAACGVVLAQLEVPMEAVEAAAELASARGATFVLNAAPGAALPEALLARVGVLVVNRGEAALIAGGDAEPEALARRLLAMGAAGGAGAEERAVVVTLGAEGALLAVLDGGVARVPAVRVRPVDTVGAGDCFVGVLAAELARGAPLAEGCRLASAAAALSTTRAGAIPSLPARAEVESFLGAGCAVGGR